MGQGLWPFLWIDIGRITEILSERVLKYWALNVFCSVGLVIFNHWLQQAHVQGWLLICCARNTIMCKCTRQYQTKTWSCCGRGWFKRWTWLQMVTTLIGLRYEEWTNYTRYEEWLISFATDGDYLRYRLMMGHDPTFNSEATNLHFYIFNRIICDVFLLILYCVCRGEFLVSPGIHYSSSCSLCRVGAAGLTEVVDIGLSADDCSVLG